MTIRVRVAVPVCLTRWPDPEDTDEQAAELDAYRREQAPAGRVRARRLYHEPSGSRGEPTGRPGGGAGASGSTRIRR